MSYFTNNIINNDDSGRGSTKWSTQRNASERLRHRPHISNTSNSRGEGYVQYYSSLDADILFGGIFIDEVVSISWQVQQNAMPIFGYNSYTFDDIAVGARFVQGTFTVNFTEANYLARVMQTMERISRKTYGKDLGETSSFSATERKIRNLPLWDKGFDIVVGYGEKNKNATEYDQVVMLNCCQLTGCQQQLDYNGEPLLETYSFIARDMKFVDSQQYFLSDNITPTFEIDTSTTTNGYDSNLTINAKINVADNNSIITTSWDDTDDDIVGVYLTLSEIDAKVFNVQMSLEKQDKYYSKTLTSEEKKSIINYVSLTGLKKLTTTGIYAVALNGNTITKDANVLIEINT